MPEGITLSVGRASFASLAPDWDGLLRQSSADPLFSSLLWQRTWLEQLDDTDEALLLDLRSGEHLLGIAPLGRRGDRIGFLAGKDVTDFLDFIVMEGQERAFFSALLDYLETEPWRQLDLHCLLPSSAALSTLAALARARNLAVDLTVEEVSPGRDLPASWDLYLAGLSKKDRHELRRKLRRLGEQNQARYYTVADLVRLPQDMADFFRLLRVSRQEKAYFMTARMEGFFRAIAQDFLAQGQLRLYFLDVDGQRVAAALCFEREHEVLLYNSGFDPAYAHLSVGLLLKAFALKDAIESGKRRFDFLRGREPYKYDLGGQDVPLYNLVIARA